MQRLYILRPNDLFPMILALPSTSLRAFRDYRVAVGLKGKKMNALITRISLKTAKNASGIAYNVASFEAINILSVTDAEKMRVYSESIGLSALKAGITSDDYAMEGREGFAPVHNANLPDDWKDAPPQPPKEKARQVSTFSPVDEDELPPGV